MAPPDNKGDEDAALAGTAISSSDNSKPIRTRGPVTIKDPMLGRTIAERYQVLEIIGKGGMGSVYLSEHIQLKKRVALKVLASEFSQQPELVTRFLKEARAAAQIGHPNIVDVFDLDELPEGGAFIAMALLEGHDLQGEVEQNGAMAPTRARIVVGEICRALAAAHSKGIVHRDMKPANVFLSRDADGREQVKVLDFGIAQIQEATGDEAKLTQTGAIVGTPAFMSPEQARGERPDHRADIYSVGCILYNLITGTQPFTATSLMGVLTKHLFEAPELPSIRRSGAGISPDLDAIVMRAMSKDPNDRFQTMKEMWTALEAGRGDEASSWMDSSSGRYVKMDQSTPAPATHSGSMHVTSGIGEAPKKSSTGLVLGGIVVLLAMCCGVAFVAFRHAANPTTTATTTTTATPTATLTTPSAPKNAEPTEVTISINTTPTGATIFDGTREIGKTPLRLVRQHSTDALDLRASLAGYADESLSVTLDHDRNVDLPLRAAAPDVKPVKTTTPVAHDTHDVHDTKPTPTTKPTAVKKAGRKGDLKDPFAQ